MDDANVRHSDRHRNTVMVSDEESWHQFKVYVRFYKLNCILA